MPRSRSNKARRNRGTSLVVPLNYQSKHDNKNKFELFSQLDFTEQGNQEFNTYMDTQEKDLYEMEIMIELLDTKPIDYMMMVPDEAVNYGAQEMKDFWTEDNWYHECDICYENTRNGDCKCLGAIQKVDTFELHTHVSQNMTTGEDKYTLVPHVVRQVPILFYI